MHFSVSLLNQSNGVDGGAIIYHGASTLKSSTPQKDSGVLQHRSQSYRCLVGSRLCWLPYPGFRVNASPIFRHFRAELVRIVKWKLETEPSRLSKVAERSS
jgi:hypothetical protein